MKMLFPSSGGTGTASSAFELELTSDGGSTGNRYSNRMGAFLRQE